MRWCPLHPFIRCRSRHKLCPSRDLEIRPALARRPRLTPSAPPLCPTHLLGAPHARDDLVHRQLVGGHATGGVPEARERLQGAQRLVRLLLPGRTGRERQGRCSVPLAGRAGGGLGCRCRRGCAEPRGKKGCLVTGGVCAGLLGRRYRGAAPLPRP